MSIELRIKSKHLACEPAIIRNEENKLKRQIKWLKNKNQEHTKLQYKLDSLINHRKIDVGKESRATYLARAYISGKPFSNIERPIKDGRSFGIIVPRVLAMVKKYHSYNTSAEDIMKWATK